MVDTEAEYANLHLAEMSIHLSIASVIPMVAPMFMDRDLVVEETRIAQVNRNCRFFVNRSEI